MPTSTRETIAGSDDLSQLWDGFAKAAVLCVGGVPGAAYSAPE